MKISVIIPVFNQGQYLAQCIESVLAQTYKAHEIIAIDDGSTDNSALVAKSYPVKLIQQVNKGLASARNTGIMNSTGDYIFPLDADDMMTENCLERITQVIEQTNGDVVAPSFKEFGISNAQVILIHDPDTGFGIPKLEDFKMGNRIGYFSAVKKEALLEVGGYSPRMVFGYEDFHLWINLLQKGKKFVTIPEVLILYRTKEQSMIHDALKHHDELMAQIHKDFPNW